eukprot:334525_1
MEIKCNWIKCVHLQRITCILVKYQSCNSMQTLDDLYNSYNDVQLLNDYIHVLYVHSADMEDIYDTFIINTCDVFKCSPFKRNYRDRSYLVLKQYSYEPSGDVIHHIARQQLLDRIHSYLYHSFDTAYMLRKEEMNKCKANVDNNKALIEYIASKRKIYHSIPGFERFSTMQSKYVTDVGFKPNNSDTYSYGYRYFYWKHYKNNPNEHDDAHWGSSLKCISHPVANRNSSLGDWYVSKKYCDLKEELTQNDVSISLNSWSCEAEKALKHTKTDYAKSKKCNRTESAAYYEMTSGQCMSKEHIIAMMIHCHYDNLQKKFNETFRFENDNESVDRLKERHQNYYWFGRRLRECVECFGMSEIENINKLPQHLYHGVCKQFTFPSIFACIKGPLSATKSESVAVTFGQFGMIIDFEINPDEWKYKFNEGIDAERTFNCFECEWLSEFSNEQEIFFIGGSGHVVISNITEPSGDSYMFWIACIRKCTSNCLMSDAWGNSTQTMQHSKLDPTAILLLRHQLYEYNKDFGLDFADSKEYIDCPDRVKKLMQAHCRNVKQINIGNSKSIPDSFFFTENAEWINFDYVIGVYPNIEIIYFDGQQYDISFFKKPLIYQSMLQIIHKKHAKGLLQILIEVNTAECSKKDIRQYIEQNDYQIQFTQNNWDIDVVTTPDWTAGIHDVVNEAIICTEKVELVITTKENFKRFPSHDKGKSLYNLYAMFRNILSQYAVLSACLLGVMIIFMWRQLLSEIRLIMEQGATFSSLHSIVMTILWILSPLSLTFYMPYLWDVYNILYNKAEIISRWTHNLINVQLDDINPCNSCDVASIPAIRVIQEKILVFCMILLCFIMDFYDEYMCQIIIATLFCFGTSDVENYMSPMASYTLCVILWNILKYHWYDDEVYAQYYESDNKHEINIHYIAECFCIHSIICFCVCRIIIIWISNLCRKAKTTKITVGGNESIAVYLSNFVRSRIHFYRKIKLHWIKFIVIHIYTIKEIFIFIECNKEKNSNPILNDNNEHLLWWIYLIIYYRATCAPLRFYNKHQRVYGMMIHVVSVHCRFNYSFFLFIIMVLCAMRISRARSTEKFAVYFMCLRIVMGTCDSDKYYSFRNSFWSKFKRNELKQFISLFV